MIKSAFIIQPESNQDFMLNQHLSPLFSFLTVSILYFFLSLVVFSPGPIGYKKPGIQLYNRVSSGQINPVIWVDIFFFHGMR